MPLTRDEILQKVAAKESLAYHDLSGADLTGANLTGADLSRADLREANLTGADLTRANLTGADLSGADLRGATLGEKDSTTRQYIESITLVPPEVGEFHAWKSLSHGHIALLRVPEDAIRYSATSRKCRVSKALVVSIFNRDKIEVTGPVSSLYDSFFTYTVGQVVEPREPFDMDRWNECSAGIHCFITRYEAETYR